MKVYCKYCKFCKYHNGYLAVGYYCHNPKRAEVIDDGYSIRTYQLDCNYVNRKNDCTELVIKHQSFKKIKRYIRKVVRKVIRLFSI